MFAIIVYLLLLLNVYCFLANKKNKYVIFLTMLVLAFLVSGMANSGGDHEFYKEEFENSREGILLDPGFTILIKLSKILGIKTYSTFLIFLYILESLLMWWGMRCFTKNPHALFAVSFAYIFPMMGVAIRFSMGMAILVFAINYIIHNKFIPFIICVGIATTIHAGIILSLIYCLAFFVKTPSSVIILKRLRKLDKFAKFMMAISLVIFIAGTSGFLSVITMFFSISETDGRSTGYIEEEIASITWVGVFIYFILYLYQKLIMRVQTLKKDTSSDDCFELKLAYSICSLILLTSFFVPFILSGIIYVRYLMAPSILLTFYLERMIYDNGMMKKGILRINKLTRMNLLLILSWFIFMCVGVFEVGLDVWIKNAQSFWGI